MGLYKYNVKISLWIFIIFSISIYSAGINADAAELKLNTQDFPPFHYISKNDDGSNGKVEGPAIELIERVCKEAGISCSLNLLPWNRAQKEVENGEAHGLFLIGWNAEREKVLYPSYPIVQTAYGFFVHINNNLQYKNLSDVAGYTVGVFGPSNTSNSLEKIRDSMGKNGVTPLKIDMRPNDEAGFRKLNLERVQAVYSNREVGNSMVAKLGLANIRYAGDHKELKYYIGFSKKYVDKSTVDKFNETFLRLHREGEIEKILAKYKMSHVPETDWKD